MYVAAETRSNGIHQNERFISRETGPQLHSSLLYIRRYMFTKYIIVEDAAEKMGDAD